jgi:hypothetical protein
MAQKRFGPVRGAGVGIIEQEGEKQIAPGALGLAGFAGIMEKGRPGTLIEAFDKTSYNKKCGSIISDSLLPDAALDYYSLANGAGGLLLVRVTDGNERKASRTLYQRNASLLTPMGLVEADNGGRWGGKEQFASGDLTVSGDLLNTTLQLPVSMATLFKTNEWKGGYIELDAVANKRYPIVGNTSTGLITVASDQKMKDDWTAAAAPTNLRFYLTLETEGKRVSILIGDGEERPDTEFSLTVLVDGDVVKKYGNLHTDPNNARYWANIINNDDGNNEIIVTDQITGAHTASQRPANHYGLIAAITSTVLTATIHDFTINSPGGGNPTFALGATTDTHLDQKITITMTSATSGTASSSRFGALGVVTLGTLFDPPNAAGGALRNKWVPPFTVTAGGSPLAATDTLEINYKPFRAGSLVGGRLYPDKVNNKRDNFRIDANTHKTITVPTGSTISSIGAIGEQFLVEAPLSLAGGRDGNADITDADYQNKAWDADASPFNRTVGKNFGLIKLATPGVTSTAVQKAGLDYASKKNHQYRVEIPANVVTESGALAYINDTIGRNDYGVTHLPTYVDVPHPDPAFAREGRLKTISGVGMILGREARIAADYDGYHKAEAGVDATLPRVLKIPTGEAILNEEQLNPAGINVIKKVRGNFILWGDRTIQTDPTWRFKHQREQMSHYEQVLRENFDWIIFAINDAASDAQAMSALQSYFIPEFVKRAIRGNTFEDAAKIKVDSEINTDATRAAGDKFAEVSLRLADTVERFIIKIGKQGIFENVA